MIQKQRQRTNKVVFQPPKLKQSMNNKNEDNKKANKPVTQAEWFNNLFQNPPKKQKVVPKPTKKEKTVPKTQPQKPNIAASDVLFILGTPEGKEMLKHFQNFIIYHNRKDRKSCSGQGVFKQRFFNKK